MKFLSQQSFTFLSITMMLNHPGPNQRNLEIHLKEKRWGNYNRFSYPLSNRIINKSRQIGRKTAQLNMAENINTNANGFVKTPRSFSKWCEEEREREIHPSDQRS